VDDDDTAIAQPALAALARMPGDAVVPDLLRALGSESSERRTAAVIALGERRERTAAHALVGVARSDEEEHTRQAAVDALARIGDDFAVAGLIDLAAEPRRAAHAVAALAGLGETRIHSVGRGLRHPNVGVRCAVVEALARMRHAGASSLLATALLDEAPSVRLAAAQALGRRDVRHADAALSEAARVDGDAAVRRAAQRARGR
jgi:HEAT repeat protein